MRYLFDYNSPTPEEDPLCLLNSIKENDNNYDNIYDSAIINVKKLPIKLRRWAKHLICGGKIISMSISSLSLGKFI